MISQTLQCFWTSPEYISQCQFVLDNSQHPYAQLLASSSLVRQVTEQTSSDPQVRFSAFSLGWEGDAMRHCGANWVQREHE